MKKYLAECIGTFFLIFCGTGAIIVHQTTGNLSPSGISAIFGAVVAIQIYLFGEASGAHFNPVVTLAFYLDKRFLAKDILPYWIAQLVGSVAASIMLQAFFPENTNLGMTLPSLGVFPALAFEMLMTCLLVWVILHLSKMKHPHTALIIGMTVALNAAFGGEVSGASMNPIRSLAPALVLGQFQNLWIYFISPLIGAMFAVFLHRYFYKHD
ncbi:MAG: MIP/aquaporin family protein [Bacteroidia bacterium]